VYDCSFVHGLFTLHLLDDNAILITKINNTCILWLKRIKNFSITDSPPQENLGIKEATFKASKRSKKKGKQKEKEYSSNSDISEDDEEVANFVRRLKKGTSGQI
jgi:hypothetical protein